jgi:hypothetical protein
MPVAGDREEVGDDVLDGHHAVEHGEHSLGVSGEQQHAADVVEGVEGDRRREQHENPARRLELVAVQELDDRSRQQRRRRP